MVQVLDVLSKDAQNRETARKAYAYNYRRLQQNISGAWFSFGDESLMKETLAELARTPYGQNVIANLSPRMQIESTRSFSSDVEGVFFSDQGKVSLNSKTMDDKMPIQTLFHELLHAKQHHLGEMETKGMSAGQVMVRSLVAEAEAEGWDRLFRVMNQSFKTNRPDKEQISKFMRMDLLSVAKRKFPNLNEDAFRKTNPVYLFQQELIEADGNLYQAQKSYVGAEILDCMAAFSDPDSRDKNERWKAYYTAQAMDYTTRAMKKGHLTQQGNIQTFHQHLDRVAHEYDIPRASLTRLNLSQTEMQVYAELIEVGKQAGFHLAEQNRSQNWQGTRVLPDEMLEQSMQGVANLRAMSN